MSNDYRLHLRTFASSPGSGMILNADEYFERKHPGESANRRAGFKLQSGQVVKEFVTIWELFDHRYEFERCLNELAAVASEIRDRFPYALIVSCTQTTRELADHLYPMLAAEAAGELRVCYFDEYPATPMLQHDGFQFSDEKVLILTDVVSSGSSIRNMAEIIRKQGGRAVALTVMVTNADWIGSDKADAGSHRLKLTDGGGLTVHFLSDYAIRRLAEEDYDKDKLIPIDYVSVLPKEPIHPPAHHRPKFSLAEGFAHLEASGAIEFGFYDLDGRNYSYAFDFPKLLSARGDNIWSSIRPSILGAANGSGHLLMVTTYKQSDLLFKNFVQDRLREESCATTSVVTLKRAVKDTPYLYLNLSEQRDRLQGKTVVLLIATLTTSEKLRGIVSLLVASHVKKIVGICLINEMGLHTTSFVSAIERFTKRISTAERPSAEGDIEFTDFDFQVVYSFLDLPSDDLAKMQQRLTWLLLSFSNRTKVDSFRRLAGRTQDYFRPRSHLHEQGAPPAYQSLDPIYSQTIHNSSVSVHTQSSKLALIAYNLAANYSFDLVFDELLATEDRHTFIQLYGLILTDINFLHFSGDLQRLKDRLVARLEELRGRRFAWEKNYRARHRLHEDAAEPPDSPIGEIVNAEIYLLFGLGIIAHYETPSSLQHVKGRWLLSANKSPGEWLTMRWNLLRHFSEERLFFMISFFFHGLYPSFSRETVAREVKNDLGDVVESFKDTFKGMAEQRAAASAGLRSRLSLLQDNLDTILTEIGFHDHQEKHQIVRYLQRQVLRPREGHNPIFTSLTSLNLALDALLSEALPAIDAFRVPVTPQVLEALDGALSATASLPLVVQAARQLFFFTPASHENQSRYSATAGQSNSFSTDTQELLWRLNEIRRRRSISREEFSRIQVISGIIHDDFFTSHLRETLEAYVVSLGEVLLKALVEANERLNQEGFKNLLRNEGARIGEIEGEWFLPVLVDRRLLQETLRNLLFNLRHAFKKERSRLPRKAVRFSHFSEPITVRPENLRQEGIWLRMAVAGRAPRREELINRDNTVADQLAKLAEFGCEWRLGEVSGEEGFLFDLGFISRVGFVERPALRRAS